MSAVTEPAHSTYAFSAASRWFEDACPASIRLTRNIKDSSSRAAELGTAAHELGEFCIKYGVSCETLIGQKFGEYSDDKTDIIVDAEMVEAVSLYVGYARDLAIKTGVKPMLEKRVYMYSLGRNDVYGTSDLVLVDLANRRLYIGDYKHGYGVVEVANNKQLIGYSISTLDTLKLWEQIDEVVTTIIQPRKSHIDGPIRSHTYTTAELVQWQQRFANSIRLAEDPNSKPAPGEHCLWCRKARCKARFEYVLELTHPDSPDDELTEKQVGLIYTKLDVIKRFCDRIEEEQLTLAREKGITPDGYKVVKGIKRAVVENEQGLLDEIKNIDVDLDKIYRKSLVSKTAANKVLPKDIVNKYWQVPPAQLTLAKMNDNRPAVKVGSTNGVFTPINNTNIIGTNNVSTIGVFTPIK